MQQPKQVTIADVAAAIGVAAPSPAEMVLTGVNSLAEAGEQQVSFLSSDQYLKQFEATRAAVVIARRKTNLPDVGNKVIFRVDDVDLAMANVLTLFAPAAPAIAAGVDPSARIASETIAPADASVGPSVVIGRNVRLGARCVIHAGAVIDDDVSIGDDCVIHSNVVIRERIAIGNRVIIHAGTILGTDGFGYRWDGKRHVKIPQIGTVTIEDDVELGSCVCIDRAKFGATVVGRGTKIDNLVQIGHNVKIGPHCIIVGQVGIAGSATLGAGVVVGGASSLRDHITVGDGAMIAARSAVHEDVPPKAIISGMPALPHRQSLREQGALRKLPELIVEMRKMQEEVSRYIEALKNGEDPLGQ